MAVKSICGAVLVSEEPESLARFYGEALGLRFEREDHGDLPPHWGVDVGTVHFGIHPPESFAGSRPGRGSVVVAFDVDSLDACRKRLDALGARCVAPPHDEGFGVVACYADPEGNLFEVVELTYRFEGGAA